MFRAVSGRDLFATAFEHILRPPWSERQSGDGPALVRYGETDSADLFECRLLTNDSLHQIVARADRAYAAREGLRNVRESVEQLRNAFAQSDNYEIAWRLSRALFFLGQQSRAEAQSARDLHAEGATFGRDATRSRPERVEGHFWAGVNLALLAALQSKPKAALHALQAKRVLHRAVAIDAAYHSAGPLRVLARLQAELPRWLGGGRSRALANFERAIASAPSNTVTRIYFAELLLDIGETSRARAELELVHSVAFDPDWAFEIARDQQRAREMLARLRSFD